MKKNITAFMLLSLLLTSCSGSDNDLEDSDQKTETTSPYISKVFDFQPGVGQFVNILPEWKEGETKEDILKKVNQTLVGSKPGMISLGGFGGYVVFGFDHTIPNLEGKDFRVLGNAFQGSSEPGIIMVSYDANKNGLPDDEWFEIAGSEYSKYTTIKNYSISYYKPDPSKKPVAGTKEWQIDIEYIKWKDNQGNSGYKTQNIYHLQSYYPDWIKEDSITFTGTKVYDNYTNTGTGESENWMGKQYEYGYADNGLNYDDASAIDISWAVDSKGNKVFLQGIDFVKVYTGVNQEAGWLGEISTEVAGAYDLHLIK